MSRKIHPMDTRQLVNYATTETPPEYVCDGCGATGCKLWREYQTVNPRLLCAPCAGADQKESVAEIDAAGKIPWEEGGHRIDQLGWYVPAVPDEEGVGYWGYTSVSQGGLLWWRRLPSLPAGALLGHTR